MSQSSDARSAPQPPRNWRGERARDAPVMRHRWQRDWTASPLARARFRQEWQRLRLGLVGLISAALLGLFGYLLLQAPVQTPVIAIAATAYETPLPLNAWASEDLAALAQLDGKSLRLLDASTEATDRQRTLSAIAAQLKRVDGGDAQRTLIIYLSMHGVVDDAGEPCLLPPAASVADASTWLPLKDVLALVEAQEKLKDWRKLIVIDGTRSASLYALGVAENDFPRRVAEVVEEANVPHLAVLTSSSAGETARTSEQLGQSVFGHFVRQGLAGRADDTVSGGDGNRRVTLQEFQRYLAQRVDGWAVQNRAGHQHPQLTPAAADFELGWALREAYTAPPAPAPTISNEQIAALGKSLDQLDGAVLLRVDPLAWQRMRRQLARLHDCAHGGAGYAKEAVRLHEQLAKSLTKLAARAPTLSTARSDYAWRGALAGSDWFPVDARRVHAYDLAERLHLPRSTAAQEALAQYDRVIAQPNIDTANAALTAFGNSGRVSVEGQSLWLARRYAMSGGSNVAAAKVLQLRLAAERSAAPRDVRVIGWIRPQVDYADGLRRAAEDALYGGDANSALAQFDTAERAYAEADAAAVRISSAMLVCDQACAELPAWAQWLAATHAVSQHAATQDGLLSGVLMPAIADAHELARQLSEPPPQRDSQAAAAVQQVAGRLETALQQLRGSLASDNQQLLKEDDQTRWPACAAEIEAALALPMLSSTERSALVERHATLTAALDRQAVSAPTNGNGKNGKNGHRDESGAHARHPLAALLQIESGKPAQLRKALREVWTLKKNDAWTLKNTASLTGRTMPEHTLRLASAIGLPSAQRDPIAEQRQQDWQALLVWQARRSLDDFLGPAANETTPYFALAAGDYLELARNAWPAADDTAKLVLGSVADLLDDRVAAARSALTTEANDSLVLFTGDPARTQVAVRPGEAAADLPAGEISLVVRDPRGELLAAKFNLAAGGDAFYGAAAPLKEAIELELVAESLTGTQALLQVAAQLRGNEFPAPLVVRAAAGPSVVVTPTTVNKASVSIAGNVRKRPAVIFVLDCSRSMEEPIAVEAADGRTAPRLEIAKNALQTMLNQLAKQGDARVGVRLVGHRVGWTTKEPLRLARQTEYGRPIPPDLAPHADVEAVLDFGRFDALAAGEVSTLMKTIVPWGQSPLYLGVLDSLSDLADSGGDDDANIIVITDGANYQFIPSTLDRIAATETQSVGDVLKAAENKNVRVHIVGFGVPRGEAERAASEFDQIAEATGGSYQSINDAGRLIAHLDALLGPSSFGVAPLDVRGNERPGGSAELGRTISLNVSPGNDNRFAVSFRALREEISLRGGEQVTLRVASDGKHLLAEPYTANVPSYGKLVNEAGEATGYSAGVHRPLRLPDGVQLTLSLKQDAGRFVARPAEIWIEAEPRDEQGNPAGPVHVWCDAVYLDGQTSPVVRWTAKAWPKSSAQAAVRCWVRETMATAEVIKPLKDALRTRGPQSDSALGKIKWLVDADRTAAAGEFEVRVAAWQVDGDFPAVKVDVVGAVSPLRIERVYDSGNRVSAHRFVFSSAQISPEELELRLTSRGAFMGDAWRLVDPVVVSVDAGVELVPPKP